MRARALMAAALLGLGAPLGAQELRLPTTAEMARELHDDRGTFAVPVGPWKDGRIETQPAEGGLTRQAWRVSGTSLTTLQLMNQLAGQLAEQGFETLFRCEDAACGGFDFRFALPVLPPPEMFVDLFDYRFLSARMGSGDAARYVTLLVSRSGAASYVQITRIGLGEGTPEEAKENGEAAPPQIAPPDPAPETGEEGAAAPDALIARLRSEGHVVLPDLDFATGAAALGEGPFASLAALADFLGADPTRRIALVGHTDTVGGYEGNLALSRRRAEAVMQRLREIHGVPAAQMEAEGIAYLAPVAPNTQAAGRERNRRVEAVLLSGD
ncbi:OmpA family protein [Roseovarius aquimarinus]|uniref:OmpA family protein n=1 Tax=Roseovarius aquimarinus TaxID=1229156 RepID=A0ABW7I5S5_9RHOB